METGQEDGLCFPRDLTDIGISGFRMLTAMLALDRRTVAVVEESSHFGETTQHILDHRPRERSSAFAPRRTRPRPCRRVSARASRWWRAAMVRSAAAGPFDVIVFGQRIEKVPGIFEELLQAAVRDGLKHGGYVVCGLVHDVDAAFHEKTGYFRAPLRAAYEAFMDAISALDASAARSSPPNTATTAISSSSASWIAGWIPAIAGSAGWCSAGGGDTRPRREISAGRPSVDEKNWLDQIAARASSRLESGSFTQIDTVLIMI